MEEITAIFRKIYGLKENKDFTGEYIENLNRKLSTEQREPIEKLRLIFEDSRVQQEVKHLGVTGLKKFYRGILHKILGSPTAGIYFHNGTRAIVSTCSISNEKGRKKYSIFLYAHDYDNQLCYIFSKRNRKMVSITPDELYQMGAQSMIIKPAYTSEEKTLQTNILEDSMEKFLRHGQKSAMQKEKTPEIDMEKFFIGEYDEEEEEK